MYKWIELLTMAQGVYVFIIIIGIIKMPTKTLHLVYAHWQNESLCSLIHSTILSINKLFYIFASLIGENGILWFRFTCLQLEKAEHLFIHYWLFALVFPWTAFHILCPFCSWLVHIHSYWFAWVLYKTRKLSFCRLYVSQVLCAILSFVSWL